LATAVSNIARIGERSTSTAAATFAARLASIFAMVFFTAAA
jgi:hypothetical protein